MKKLLAIVLIALSGCGGKSEPDDNHGFGWQYDAAGRNGLHLRQAGATTVDAEFMEAIARTVGICSGIEAPPPPFVIVVPAQSLYVTRPDGSIDQRIGLYKGSPPLILLDAEWVGIAYPHEVLHFQLERATGKPDSNHESPLWDTCVFS